MKIYGFQPCVKIFTHLVALIRSIRCNIVTLSHFGPSERENRHFVAVFFKFMPGFFLIYAVSVLFHMGQVDT